MNVCQLNAEDLPSLVSLRVFMLLPAVYKGELFVNTKWKVTRQLAWFGDRIAIAVCRLGSVDGLVPVP